jgi:hypothetical protein
MINLPRDEFFYLATPYSKYEGGIERAFIDACKVAAAMVKEGIRVYSPIAHTHGIAVHGGIDPLDHKIWLPFDETMMQTCTAIAVALLPGWEKSFGVHHEIATFDMLKKPVHYLQIDPAWLA